MAQPPSLRGTLKRSARLAERRIWGAAGEIALADLAGGTALGGAAATLAGRSVLLRLADPIYAAVALVELDGVARRIVLAPPDLADDALRGVIEAAAIEAAVTDGPEPIAGLPTHRIAVPVQFQDTEPASTIATEWVMFTSGTSGPPKMVVHSLAGLTGAIKPPAAGAPPPIWGTFYDIRRYGGLQILLRALLGEGSLAITAPAEPMPAFLTRLARVGVTHLTGTPSHWRRALMTPQSRALAPAYVRLSGEIADQPVLEALKARFPGVPIGHAYASTEAGVGFEVNDGLAGFPAAYVGRPGEVELRVVDGSLQLRSARAAAGYVDGHGLADAEGFVDTGDMVELRADRYHFVGRRGGVINVGGLKAHPEEIEAVINAHPAVRMSRVSARRSPITGAIVAAEVVLADPRADEATAKAEILAACRERLAPFKVPALVRVVPSLPMTAGGKLERAIG
ncbi:MAG TPA: fatty acid--CoA ligase family protein [Caulobacteraceae bacterium]|nr:fatty acid--CoA ligase family protein [Caulobacteraceae bacterium]